MATRAESRSLTPAIHMSYVGAIGRYLRRRGHDPGRLYARFGWTAASIDDGQAYVPIRDFFALLDAAAAAARDPHLGMHVYEQFDFADLGLLGFALLSARNVGAARRTPAYLIFCVIAWPPDQSRSDDRSRSRPRPKPSTLAR